MLPELFSSLEAFQNWFDFDNLSNVEGKQQVVAAEQRGR